MRALKIVGVYSVYAGSKQFDGFCRCWRLANQQLQCMVITDITVSDERHQAVNSTHAGDVADSRTLCSWTSLMSISCISCDLSSSTCLKKLPQI